MLSICKALFLHAADHLLRKPIQEKKRNMLDNKWQSFGAKFINILLHTNLQISWLAKPFKLNNRTHLRETEMFRTTFKSHTITFMSENPLKLVKKYSWDQWSSCSALRGQGGLDSYPPCGSTSFQPWFTDDHFPVQPFLPVKPFKRHLSWFNYLQPQ